MSRMHRFDWLSRQTTRRSGRSPYARRLRVEALEERRMLAVLTVNSPLDNITPGDNLVTLREAITAANQDTTTDLGETGDSADTIVFDATVFATPQTIALALDEIVITEAVTIDGPGQELLTIDAQLQSRIFNITATTGDFTIAGLSLTGGNTTVNDALGAGGAIRSLTSGSLIINESTVSGNSTGGDYANGGGIRSIGNVTLTKSTVSGNSTAGDYAIGGGIISSGDVTLTQSTVSGNSTASDFAHGGGIFSGGDVTLTQSTVSGNSTAGSNARTGGISSGGNVTLMQSTVSGNSTAGVGAHGGGILSGGDVTLTQSTVTNNHANDSQSTGGGIWNSNDTIAITGSIVADNTAGGGMPDIDPGIGTLNVDFSLIEQVGLPVIGSGNILGLAADLGPLANNGGLTMTHGLLAGSLAIDAGDPGFITPPDFDQRGAPFARIVDGGGAGLRIDMGATERQTLPGLNLVVDTPIDENDGDYSAGDLSLREAVGLASGSAGADTITFDATVFAAPQTLAVSLGEIDIGEAVTINGPGQELLTIDAHQQSRIFNITATTGDFTLFGLTLTGGRTTVNDALGAGGAIRSLTTGNLIIDESTVSGNTAAENAAGGGIFSSGAVTLTQSIVSENSTGFFSGEGGGGIYSLGDATLSNSTLSGNSTTGDNAPGGGIFSLGDVTLTISTVSGNSTGGSGANGGGISSNGDITLIQSTVNENSTTGIGAFGGGISSFGDITLTSSTVSDNSTADTSSSFAASGGGIFASGAVTLTQSTVSGNSTAADVAVGAGIRASGAVMLMRSTITDNHANGSSVTGGGIWNDNDPIEIIGSIVAGNTAGGGMDDIDPGTGMLNVDFSLIEQVGLPLVGSGNIQGMPADLGPLANNGGLTKTHPLLAGSPAIDAGDPSIVFNPAEFDQRGAPFARVVDGGVAGLRIDIGATERQTLPGLNLIVGTLVDEKDTDYTTGDLSLREAVGLANGSVGADTITFDSALSGGTILLTLGQLNVTDDITIDGSGQSSRITIDASGNDPTPTVDNGDGSRVMITGGGATNLEVTIRGLQFVGGDSAGSGGSIHSTEDLTLDDVVVSGNYAMLDGGGIFVDGGRLDMVKTSIDDNRASGSGGAISADSAIVTATQSTIDANRAGGSGGGIVAEDGTTVLTDTTVSRNIADAAAGGILIIGGSQLLPARLTINNSTVAFNRSAGDGGGMRLAGVSQTIVNNSTIANNRRVGADPFVNVAGGIRVVAGAQLVIQDTIVANNTTNSINGVNDIAGDVTSNYSLIRDTNGANITGANNVLGADPLLDSLADNGGPTDTMALLAGSQAIDAGDPNFTPPPDFDQRGAPFARVVGGRIDIGSVEDQPIPDSADFDVDGDIDGRDFLFWQRGFGTPNATKADGDADNDLDVDSDDLTIWEQQFATTAPVVAPSNTLSSIEPLATPSPISNELVDAALAVALTEDANRAAGTKEMVANAPPLDVFSTGPNRQRDLVAISNVAGEANTSTRVSTSQSPDGPIEWADTLDEAFASAFD